jgi:PiT family inorganic phosphate transporter
VPPWVILLSALAIALGTYSGGWRIIRTMGQRIIRLEPINGFAVESTAASILLTSSFLGLPVSTTQVVSSTILGVGATRNAGAVRWGMAGSILTAWILTLPASALVGALAFTLLHIFGAS